VVKTNKIKKANEREYKMKNLNITISIFKKSVISFIFSGIIFITFNNTVFSQDNTNIEGVVNSFVQYGQTTLQPYADAVSADMNSGWFHTAKVNNGFSIYLGIKATGTYINGDNPVVVDANKTLNIMPMAVPQLNIGSVWGTEVSVRYLPQINIGSYGSVGTFGIGIKHGITSHFKNFPVDAAVQLSYQTIKINNSKDIDMVNASSYAASLQVSKELSVFTFYSGLQYESTSINTNVKYEETNINMNFVNQNKLRGIFGLNIKLGPVNLNGDYSVGKSNSISAGFGFGF